MLPVEDLKMAKICTKIANVSIFCHCWPLTGSKTLQKHFLSCRVGSKLQFGGSYVKIGLELSSGMSFKDLQVKMR